MGEMTLFMPDEMPRLVRGVKECEIVTEPEPELEYARELRWSFASVDMGCVLVTSLDAVIVVRGEREYLRDTCAFEMSNLLPKNSNWLGDSMKLDKTVSTD